MSVLDSVRGRSLFDPQNKRLVLYVMVGAVGAGINQTITVGLPQFGVPYLLAGMLGRVVSTLSNYVLNDSVTWRGRGAAGFVQWCWRGVKYVATRLVGIGIGTAGLFVFVDLVGTSVFWGNLFSMALGLAWGFGASEKWVWASQDSSVSLESITGFVSEDERE